MSNPLLLGYDIGSSFVKASLIDAETGTPIASGSSPDREMKIDAPHSGWAEQHPDHWWKNLVSATTQVFSKTSHHARDVRAIGISYQMHGLVVVDRNGHLLYPSIIWCDSRAVEIGNTALAKLGKEYCLGNCLNSPGNFTASKLKWIKDNRPDVYSRVFKIMLPGDYVAFKLTGEMTTTVSGLSEGIFWDFKNGNVAVRLMEYFGFDENVLPKIVPTFGVQGLLIKGAAEELGLETGIPISYRAGDQPNNALSLNVLDPGEIAATAGTSGVIYGVTAKNAFDPAGRVNTFAHVNYSEAKPNKGVLLCINGTGIQYSWMRQNVLENRHTYEEMNEEAASVAIGSDGVRCFPYGNGAERMLENRDVGCRFSGINFNTHDKRHLIRAAQEGIAFSFRYGLDVLKSVGLEFDVIRAGNSNLFQSRVFKEVFVNTCDVDLEIYNTEGSQGAARGAGIGIALFSPPKEAFRGLNVIERVCKDPNLLETCDSVYGKWKTELLGLVGGSQPGGA